MTAKSGGNTQKQVAASAAVSQENIVRLSAGQGGKRYDALINLAILPMDDMEFRRKLAKVFHQNGIWRNEEYREGFKDDAPINTEQFVTMVRNFKFQDESGPTKADEKAAQSTFDSVTAGNLSWEDVEAFIAKNFPWKLEARTLAGLALHQYRKRMKKAAEAEAAKAANPLADLM